MVTQKVGDEYEEGMDILRDLYAKASKDERTEVPLSELRVGLKCGGSDGFSGITANPLLGMFSDFLIAQGGTSVLTEVPEMFGAETILMNRCENKDLFEQTVHLINDFKNISCPMASLWVKIHLREIKPAASPLWKKKHWDVHRNVVKAMYPA